MKIGLLSLSVNDPAAAIAWLTRASAAAPEDLKTLVALAEAELKAGHRDAAQATLKSGLQLDPANIQLRGLSKRLL